MPEEYEVSLTDYLMVLWREKWIVIVTFAVAIAAALLAVSQLPAQYQVETSLLIFPPLGPGRGRASRRHRVLPGDLQEPGPGRRPP